MNNRTLVIRAKNHTGTITSIASFFSRRNISVEEISCSATHGSAEMVCTVTYEGTGRALNMVPHLNNMHDVIEAYYGE